MPKIVRVRLLKEELKAAYGEYMHRAIEVAVRGQAAGLWEIVDEVGLPPSVRAERRRKGDQDDEAAYMTREMFARRGSLKIHKKDLSGGA